MHKGTVLTVDDDDNLQLVIEQYLESDGYKVVKAGSVQSATDIIGSAPFDVILLDLGLPDGEGLSLITLFRSQSNVPIIVVSGKSDTTEKIICLEMGADDYLTKPFEMRELSARIKAALRRMDVSNDQPADKRSEADKIQLENWILDRAQFQVFSSEGNSLELTTGEFQLLEALALAPNRALSREQLFELTRDGEFDAYDRAIDIQIARIRKKLGDDKSEIIKTVRGVGYMYFGKADAL
jgi:DNA-binding response OmpR family regulator